MNKIFSVKKVHFVGIGGIGVSALAQWFLGLGARVTGSNLSREPILTLLKKRGAKIKIGRHTAANTPKDTELVIYTLAAPANNPERREARRRGIPEMSYPEAVGELTKNKFTIAVSGAHGKSTTAGLVASLLCRANLEPTVIVGATLGDLGDSNFRFGKSKYLVLEADEWRGAFWNYRPDIAILTTIDAEHLDFYRNFRGVQNGFKKYLRNIKPGGIVIANGDDPVVRKIVLASGKPHYFYSLRNYRWASPIRRVIKIPGEHNVSNALAAMTLGRVLGIRPSQSLEAIARYRGAGRRFEYKGALNAAPVYDDYGHHPAEIKATLAAAREKFGERLAGGKLWCVFQPHQYQRTRYLFDEFSRAFSAADIVVLLDIYGVAGRERAAISKTVNSRQLAEAIRSRGVPVVYQADIRGAARLLGTAVEPGDRVVVMGAGNIWEIYKWLDLR